MNCHTKIEFSLRPNTVRLNSTGSKDAAVLTSAPIMVAPCGRKAGHAGRHVVARSVTLEWSTAVEDEALGRVVARVNWTVPFEPVQSVISS